MSYIQWLRREIGHQKTILVYSTVILRDEKGRILLQRRSDFDWWGLPGGILERGEDIVTCARRELREETGLVAGSLRLVGVYTDPRYDVAYPNGDETQQFSVCLTGTVIGGTAEPDGDEILQLTFAGPHELPNYAIPTWYRAMISDSQNPAAPAYEWEASAVAPFSNGQPALSHDSRYIQPAAIAVLTRQDGRIFAPRDGLGRRTLPAVPMRLGETVAAAAVRSLADYGFMAAPRRLLGVVSLLGELAHGLKIAGQVVAAVFMLEAGNPTGFGGASCDWLLPHQLTDVTSSMPVLMGSIAGVLSGGAFVDQEVTQHV